MIKITNIIWMIGLCLLYIIIPVSAYNVQVDLNDNAIIFITLLIVFFITLFISLRSTGIYKSLIALSGIFLICLTLLFREMLINNNLSKASIIIVTTFSGVLLLASLGMIYIGVTQLFSKK